MQSEALIQNAVDWNIRQRDNARRCNDTYRARHFQRNIDRLNEQLRQAEEASIH